MKRLVAVLAFAGVTAVVSAQVSMPPCPTMEVSVVADGPEGAARSFPTASGQSVSLTATPLLTVGDFNHATVTLTEGQIVLNVTMNRTAANRVQQFSATHVGQRMAFVVDGRVINTPKILDPITGDGFLLAPFERSQADALAALINGRMPECRQESG